MFLHERNNAKQVFYLSLAKNWGLLIYLFFCYNKGRKSLNNKGRSLTNFYNNSHWDFEYKKSFDFLSDSPAIVKI